MKVVYINENDIADGATGVAVSLWVGDCPHKCKGCHNSELWETDFPEADNKEIAKQIISSIKKDGLVRDFSVLGGEPLMPSNIEGVAFVVKSVRKAFPDIKIYCWTGYTLEELKNFEGEDLKNVKQIIDNINYLIEGRYIESLRDTSLRLRGSSNQRVFRTQNKGFDLVEVKDDNEKL